MAPVAVRPAGRVDVDVLALAEAWEQVDPELAEQRVEGRLVGGDPLAAQLVRLAADLGVPDPSPDPVAGLEHDHVDALAGQRGRCREAGDAGPDHRYICLNDAISATGLLKPADRNPALSLCGIPLGWLRGLSGRPGTRGRRRCSARWSPLATVATLKVAVLALGREDQVRDSAEVAARGRRRRTRRSPRCRPGRRSAGCPRSSCPRECGLLPKSFWKFSWIVPGRVERKAKTREVPPPVAAAGGPQGEAVDGADRAQRRSGLGVGGEVEAHRPASPKLLADALGQRPACGRCPRRACSA